MAEAARTEDEADVMPDRQAIVRSLRVLADRFDRFAEQLETAGGEGFRPGRTHRISSEKDGQTYGFVVYDEADRACVYLGFSTWHQADVAARRAQSLLVAAFACLRQ